MLTAASSPESGDDDGGLAFAVRVYFGLLLSVILSILFLTRYQKRKNATAEDLLADAMAILGREQDSFITGTDTTTKRSNEQNHQRSPVASRSPTSSRAIRAHGSFRSLKKRYLIAYLLAVFADWLQGPYIYALYHAYGYSKKINGVLFIWGFGSSALFGTLIAGYADKYGRKRFCVLYCFVYILGCCTKHFNKFSFLCLGRVFAGISTSLLFSVFESWVVCEVNRKNIPEDGLSEILSWAIFGNSIVAIIAGFVAQIAAETMEFHRGRLVEGGAGLLSEFVEVESPGMHGHASPWTVAPQGAPSVAAQLSFTKKPDIAANDGHFYIGGYLWAFDVAIAVLMVCAYCIMTKWEENYGSSEAPVGEADDQVFGAIELVVQQPPASPAGKTTGVENVENNSSRGSVPSSKESIFSGSSGAPRQSSSKGGVARQSLVDDHGRSGPPEGAVRTSRSELLSSPSPSIDTEVVTATVIDVAESAMIATPKRRRMPGGSSVSMAPDSPSEHEFIVTSDRVSVGSGSSPVSAEGLGVTSVELARAESGSSRGSHCSQEEGAQRVVSSTTNGNGNKASSSRDRTVEVPDVDQSTSALALLGASSAKLGRSGQRGPPLRGRRDYEEHSQIGQAWYLLKTTPEIQRIGAITALFEAALFIFVFLWTPALAEAVPQAKEIEYGIIFALFMLGCGTGSCLFTLLSDGLQLSAEQIGIVTLTLAAGSNAVVSALIWSPGYGLLPGFVGFEIADFPMIGVLKSRYVPERSRSMLYNFFRVPLNLIVLAVLYFDIPVRVGFGCVTGMLLLCLKMMHSFMQEELMIIKSGREAAVLREEEEQIIGAVVVVDSTVGTPAFAAAALPPVSVGRRNLLTDVGVDNSGADGRSGGGSYQGRSFLNGAQERPPEGGRTTAAVE